MSHWTSIGRRCPGCCVSLEGMLRRQSPNLRLVDYLRGLQHLVISTASHYHPQHEPCWYAVRKGAKTYWRGDRKQNHDLGHPKPESFGRLRANRGTQRLGHVFTQGKPTEYAMELAHPQMQRVLERLVKPLPQASGTTPANRPATSGERAGQHRARTLHISSGVEAYTSEKAERV